MKKLLKNDKLYEISVSVRDLCNQKKYDEALAILNNLDTYDTALLNQKMSIYKSQNKYKLAMEVHNSISDPDEDTMKNYEILIKEIFSMAHKMCFKGQNEKAIELINLIKDEILRNRLLKALGLDNEEVISIRPKLLIKDTYKQEVAILGRFIDIEIKNGNEGAILLKNELETLIFHDISDKESVNKLVSMLDNFKMNNKEY